MAPLRFTGIWMCTVVQTGSAKRLLGWHPTQSHAVTLTFEALGAALNTYRPGLVALDLARTTGPATGECFAMLAGPINKRSGGRHHGMRSGPVLISKLRIWGPNISEKVG